MNEQKKNHYYIVIFITQRSVRVICRVYSYYEVNSILFFFTHNHLTCKQ